MNLEFNRVSHKTRYSFKRLNYKSRRIVISGAALFIASLVLMIILLPNGKVVQPNKDSVGLVVDGKIIETANHPIVEGDQVLLSFDDIKKNIDKNIYFDKNNAKVIVTTDTKVIKIKADKETGTINNKLFVMKTSMKMVNNVPYIPIDAFKQYYNIDVKYIKDNNAVTVLNKGLDIKTGISKYEAKAIRRADSIKEPIYKKLIKGEQIRIFGENEKWYKVMASNGAVGFIQKRYVSNINVTKGTVNNDGQYIRWKPNSGKINLVWDQFENTTPAMDNVLGVEGLDVVVPTWFQITDANGSIKNKADSSYVTWARANGYKVWGMVSNPHKKDVTTKILENAETREKVINQLLYLTQLYDIDGINVDFEEVSKKDKDLLTQFVRELAPLFKEKGLTVTVDVTVKVEASDNSECFDRKALGEVADYVILMSYDQYWSTSPVSGSVAQYAWVEESIKSTLSEVLKDKLIMGVPFYTRQWKEAAGSKPISNSMSMANTRNIIRQYNARVQWDDASGQNYAEFEKGGAKFRIWVEDAKSINLKSSLALKYDIAGLGAWRRGYETPDIWGVLKKNLKDSKTYEEWKKNN